jgi:hypothetical protein
VRSSVSVWPTTSGLAAKVDRHSRSLITIGRSASRAASASVRMRPSAACRPSIGSIPGVTVAPATRVASPRPVIAPPKPVKASSRSNFVDCRCQSSKFGGDGSTRA